MGIFNTGSRQFERNLRQTVDWKLVLCYIAIVLIGWVSIYASVHSTEPSSIFDPGCRSGKQFVWIVVALLFDALILFTINPRLWEVITPVAYLMVFCLLVLVIFVSKDVKGSHSWFEFGPVKFQPAEVSKITTSLMLAMVMSRQGFRLASRKGFLSVALIIGLPMLAILGESETGSALVYVGYLFVLYREGFSGWWFIFLGSAVVLFILTLTAPWWAAAIFLALLCAAFFFFGSGFRKGRGVRMDSILKTLAVLAAGVMLIFATDFLFDNVLQDHQRKRIEVLLGMKEDPSGVGYNVRQSMIAIGSGGLLGKGFGKGVQKFLYLPEEHNDFIFAVVCEELGLVGACVIMLIFAMLLLRGFWIALHARDRFGTLLVVGIMTQLGLQVFLNIAVVSGLVPATGISLPFFSYGGTALALQLAEMGIVLSVSRQIPAPRNG